MRRPVGIGTMTTRLREEAQMTETKSLMDHLSLDELMELDAVAEGEKLAKILRTGPEDITLGLAFAQSAALRKKLQDFDDTYYGCELEEFLGVAKRLGFVLKHTFEFEGDDAFEPGKTHQEKIFILMSPDHFLLHIETYRGTGVNRAEIGFAVRVAQEKLDDFYRVQCSRGPLYEGTNWMTSCHMDVREGLRLAIERIRGCCELLSKWEKYAFFGLGDYASWKWKDEAAREALWAKRYAELPEDVRALMNGHYR